MNKRRTVILSVLAAYVILLSSGASSQDTSTLPYMNARLSPEERAALVLAPQKVAAIKKAVPGPKTSEGVQVYPGFL